MSDITAEAVIDIVGARFEVLGIDRRPDVISFRVQGDGLKERFVGLALELESMDLAATMSRDDSGTYIAVMRMATSKKRAWLSSPWIMRGLFAVVVSFVMIDGFYRTERLNDIVNLGDPLEMALIYTASLLGILGVHEAGHMAAARLHRLKTSWPYFIPGIPVFGFVPTFGALIRARSLTINREILFDVAIAGPVAGLVIAVIVSFYGAYTAPVLDIASNTPGLSEWTSGYPLLMTIPLEIFDKGGDNQTVLMTPVLFAAWVGFLITFLNLLPASQLDGGHMMRTLVGPKWHRIATYGSMMVLVLLGYWLMAIFILALSARNPSARMLDDISPLSSRRKYAYFAVVSMAVLCAPLPEWLLTEAEALGRQLLLLPFGAPPAF